MYKIIYIYIYIKLYTLYDSLSLPTDINLTGVALLAQKEHRRSAGKNTQASLDALSAVTAVLSVGKPSHHPVILVTHLEATSH